MSCIGSSNRSRHDYQLGNVLMMKNLDKINNVLLLAKKVVSNTSPTDPDVVRLLKSIEDLLECLVWEDPTDPDVDRLMKFIEDLSYTLSECPTDPDMDRLMKSVEDLSEFVESIKKKYVVVICNEIEVKDGIYNVRVRIPQRVVFMGRFVLAQKKADDINRRNKDKKDGDFAVVVEFWEDDDSVKD